jgi:hypothetical protein
MRFVNVDLSLVLLIKLDIDLFILIASSLKQQ